MAAASHRDLDPRQVKAREEFERMREQLTRSLERPVDPAPWRERARERVAAFERETRRKRPLAVAAPQVGLPRWAPLAAAFVLGVVSTAVVAFFVLRDAGGRPETTVADASIVAASSSSAPDAQATLSPAAASPEATVVTPPEPAPVIDAAAAPTETVEIAAAVISAAAIEPPPVVIEPVVEEVALEEQAALETPAPAPVEETASPTRDPVVEQVARVREIQTLLIAQGHALGRPDGDAGPQTLSAASAFATTYGLADANLDEAFLAALRKAEAGYLVPLAPLAQRDPVLEQINRVRNAQDALNELGYALGRPDGDAGPQTLAAIEEFAASRGLADVAIDEAMVAVLQQAADAR